MNHNENSRGATNPFLTWWFMASAAVLLAILVAGLLLGFKAITRDDAPQPEPQTQTQAAPATCDLPASDQTGLTAIPETGWKLIGAGENSMSVPVSDTAGPAQWDGQRPSCWQQSPTGAVLSSAFFVALASTGDQHDLYTLYTVPGPARDAALAETPEDEETYTTGLKIEAFRLVNYTPDDAQVEIVVSGTPNQNSEPVYAAATFDVTYHDGDWKYRAPTSGEPSVKQITTLDGYTNFTRS